MKTFGVTDYTNLAPLKNVTDGLEKILSSTPVKNERKNETIAQNRRRTSSICEQSLGKV